MLGLLERICVLCEERWFRMFSRENNIRGIEGEVFFIGRLRDFALIFIVEGSGCVESFGAGFSV